MTQIRLGQSDSVYSNNVENSVHVQLEQNTKLLPYTEVEDKINIYEVYNAERDASRNYRLTFTLNPICTNVLYNMRTEVVQNEGAGNCVALVKDGETAEIPEWASNSTTLDRKQAIRDTEYSHNMVGNFKYHCGLDMLNNHKLRTNDFIHINKVKENTPEFNTMWDYKRDYNGNVIEEYHPDGANDGDNYMSGTPTPTHIYQLDNILTFEEAFKQKFVSRDGWYGFVNSASINIPSAQKDDANLFFNKIIQYNKPCEIYNLYPDRSLYSFTPKINKARKRLEYNWDYVLTYPYFSDTEKFNAINQNGRNGIKMLCQGTWNPNGNREYIIFKSLIKHNLQVNDKIRIYLQSYGATDTSSLVRVVRLGDVNGDNKDTYFMIDLWGNENLEGLNTCFKKEANGAPCQYYIRKFKKLKKVSDGEARDYMSQLGKMGYAENIFGDPMAQIIYTDTINTDGLVDNLGRDLSEIYLTIIKTNKGHNLWYSENPDYKSAEIEFSHCFGKVTSGFDLGDGQANYNVRKLHNITRTGDADLSGLWSVPDVLEDDITLSDNFDEFYGDIVEFDPNEYKETILEHVYYRFNTAQRECCLSGYGDIFDDELISDDYDTDGFEIQTTNINTEGAYGNLQPEGYFYNPHYRIKLRDVDTSVSKYLGHKIVLVEGSSVEYSSEGENYKVSFEPSNNYEYLINDVFAFYNYKQKAVTWGSVSEISGDVLTVKTVVDLGEWETDGYDIILTDGSVPFYAMYLPVQETFVWRNTVLPSSDDTDANTFTNGCFYINTQVNLFLRRQDPTNKYGLLDPVEFSTGNPSPTRKYKFRGKEVALSALSYIINETNFACV